MKPVGLAETAGRVYDGFQVFFGRKEALSRFGTDRDAFLKSFWPALLVYPLFMALVLGLPHEGSGLESPPLTDKIVGNTAYWIIAWIYWPLIVSFISEAVGRGDKWIPFVVTVNWMTVTPLLINLALIAWLPDSGGPLAQGLDWGLRLWAMLIHGWLLQTFFRTSLAVTLLLVLSDQFLGLVLSDIRVIVLYHGVSA